MTGAVRRVTIVGRSKRLDVAVPADLPVVDLLADLVPLLGEPVDRAALPRWALGRATGPDLPPGSTLDAAGVDDGAVLRLRPVDEPVVGLHGVDPVEQAGAGAGAARDRDRLLLSGAAATVLTVVAGLLAREGGNGRGLAAALLGLAVAAGAAWLPAARSAVLVLSLPAVLLGAAAGTCLRAASGPLSHALPVGLLGACAGAVVVAVGVRPARTPAAATALTAGLAAAAVLAGQATDGPRAAAVTAVAAVLAVPALPRLALRLTRTRSPVAGLPAGREALAWAAAGAGALVVGSAVVLARHDDRPGWALAALAGLLLVLRSRDVRGAGAALPLAVAGHLAVAVTGAGLALSRPASAWPLVVLGGTALAYVLAAGVPAAMVDAPRWARRRRLVEAVALAALVPLLAAVLGVFGWVVDVARGVE